MTDKITAVLELLSQRAKTMNGARPVGGGDGSTYVSSSYGPSDARLDQQAIEVIEELQAELAEANSLVSITRKANSALADLMIEEGVLLPQGQTMEDILREQLEKPNFPRVHKSTYANRSSGGFED